MSELKVIPLDECLELLIDYRGKSPPKSEAGIPVISAKVVKDGRVLREIKQRISPDFYPKWMTRGFPNTGDVVLTTEGPLGEVAQLDAETVNYALGQRVVVLRGKKGVLDNTFLKFLLLSKKQQEILASYATGTTVAGISQKALRTVPLSLPNYADQVAIGYLLGAIDEKIDVNRRISESVDLMAREVFRDWFVAYGPVHSKRDGRTHSGLDAGIATLFPSEFNEEGAPLGWAKRKLADVATVVKGKSYKSSELLPSNTALVTLKSFNRGGGYRLDGLKEFIGQYKPEQEVFSGDLIIAYTDVTQAADVIGKPALVMPDDRYEHLVISLDVGAIRPSNVEHRLWLYGLALTETFQHHMRAHTTGTTVLHLSSAGIPNFTFYCPPDALIQAYNDFATPLFSQIEANIIENSNLAKMRDFLLPRLLSGELRIKDAEHFLEMRT
jgi:type I restriction enzyme S subunit